MFAVLVPWGFCFRFSTCTVSFENQDRYVVQEANDIH